MSDTPKSAMDAAFVAQYGERPTRRTEWDILADVQRSEAAHKRACDELQRLREWQTRQTAWYTAWQASEKEPQ